MLRLLSRLRLRLGDFWWYTLMIFCAQRAADALNVFVGLYLVPKYVAPEDLGAVMPLTQFASMLAIPAGVFAVTFRQELSSLALRRDFGRMKALMRGVFLATAVFFVLALLVSRLLLPHFLERIRIAEGSLGIVILASAFIGATAPVYTNALQALKKFKALSLVNILCAPVRLVTMLVAMPFRALTGYFVGQAANPAFATGASLYALRRELAVPAIPYWNRTILRRFAVLFAIFALNSLAAGAVNLAEATIIRQRLPELDSAAYYLVTRFSDISTFLSATLMITIFPFAADLSARGRDNRPLVLKCMGATLLFGAALAFFFILFGEPILRLLPHGDIYDDFAPAIPAMIGVSIANQCGSVYVTASIAANRFGYLLWMVPLQIGYVLLLFFAPRIDSLMTMILYLFGYQFIRLIACLIEMWIRPNESEPSRKPQLDQM